MQKLKSKSFKNFEEQKLNKSLETVGGYGGEGGTLRPYVDMNGDVAFSPDHVYEGKGKTPSL